MDKNAIKRFATWARVELIARVSQKAEQLGVTSKHPGNPKDQSVHGHLLSAQEQSQRAALIARVTAKGWQHTMEEVAYTWFNRFCALRYMEVNGYLPSRVRVFSDEEGAFKPQILTEAIHVELKGLDRDRVYQYKEKNQTEALYRYLLVAQCNALNSILPRMFQRIEDDTELLLPDNLLREGSVIEQMISLIPEEDWTDQVQIIGWLYQYYNAEPKDKVFANLKKNIKISKHDIPAATQLFTPDWIVRYMVENSLGRIWLERERALDDSVNEKTAADSFGWKYYLEEAEQEPQVQVELKKQRQSRRQLQPAHIKCIDPCMGSGHILVYMFDVLMQIYKAYGYSDREAVESILENNLYGLDIDDRAAQLAYFAVMMKARQHDRRLLTRTLFDGRPDIPQPQVYPIIESNALDADMVAYFVGKDTGLRDDMETLIQEMKDAKEYGSILTISPVDFDALYARFDEVFDEVSMYRDGVLNILLPFVRQAQALAQQYEVVVTNPPYMGSSGMNGNLTSYVNEVYPDSKSDLFAVFMERGFAFSKRSGFSCMVTMQSWMFLSSFEKLRKNILGTKTITNLMHMENMVLGIAFGTAVANIRNENKKGYTGTYNHIRMADIKDGEPTEFPVSGNRFAQTDQQSFTKIPGAPVAYWAGEPILAAFVKGVRMDALVNPRQGLATADNDRFIRLWHEVIIDKTSFDSASTSAALASSKKWFPYNKGGERRQWYGNYDYLVNWENDGDEIRNFKDSSGKVRSRPQNTGYYFLEAITWGLITSGGFSIRYRTPGGIHDVSGMSAFTDNHQLMMYLLALTSTHLADYVFKMVNPTINLQIGDFNIFPVIKAKDKEDVIIEMAESSVEIAKKDWDSFETSWDFKRHPML